AFIYYGGPSLDATPDVTLTAESNNTWFGSSVSSAGDVNGDGFDGVIVGAPNYGSQAGRVYGFFGGSTPDAIADRVFTDPNASDQLGWSVGGGADMNGDSYPDMFAIAPRWYGSGTDPGAAFVWFGGPGFDTVADLTIHGTVLSDRINAAAGGDINADGFADLILARQDRAEGFYGGSSPQAEPGMGLSGGVRSVAPRGASGGGVGHNVR